MNRLLLLLTLTFFVLKLSSQNKYFISIEASPVLSYRSNILADYSSETIENPSGSFIFDNFEKNYDSIESSKLGYQISLNLGYNITDKISIHTGIKFKNIGLKTEFKAPIGIYESDISVIVPDYDFTIEQYSNIYYLGVPINLAYKVYSKNKFNLNLNLGGTVDFLLSYDSPKNTIYSTTATEQDFSEYSSITLNINGGIQISYSINDKFNLYIMPEYTRYLTPNIKFNIDVSDEIYAKINQYHYFGDLKIGLQYKL
ncbi:MAG: outer membrane beta-barrel protein [Bacteroidales bacterium]|nr:outer membrane beta-barrel protein [Bacteroidales bacterium]